MLHIEVGFHWPSGFKGWTEHRHPISSPCEPSAQVSKLICNPLHTRVLLYISGVQVGSILNGHVFLML